MQNGVSGGQIIAQVKIKQLCGVIFSRNNSMQGLLKDRL